MTRRCSTCKFCRVDGDGVIHCTNQNGDMKIETFNNGCKLYIDDASETYNPVTKPEHYANTKVECIDAMIALFGVEAVKSFCICNAFKYHWRHRDKNGQEDIAKASWYMDKYKELVNL